MVFLIVLNEHRWECKSVLGPPAFYLSRSRYFGLAHIKHVFLHVLISIYPDPNPAHPAPTISKGQMSQ